MWLRLGLVNYLLDRVLLMSNRVRGRASIKDLGLGLCEYQEKLLLRVNIVDVLLIFLFLVVVFVGGVL